MGGGWGNSGRRECKFRPLPDPPPQAGEGKVNAGAALV
jgi:hypothetical protein